MIVRRAACAAILATLAASPARASPPIRVMVLGVEETEVIGKDIARLPEVIAKYVATHPGFEAVPEIDMRLAVGATGKTQRTCVASRACLDEVGKATNSDYVISTSVTSLPSGFVVEMSRTEVGTTVPPRSAVEKTIHRSEIPQHVRQCVDRLFTWKETSPITAPPVVVKAPPVPASPPKTATPSGPVEPEPSESQPGFLAAKPKTEEPVTPFIPSALPVEEPKAQPIAAAAPPPAHSPEPAPPPAAMPWQRIMGWVGVAVGGAALATGVGLGVSSRAEQSEIHTSTRSGATALQIMNSSNTNAIGADIAMVGGGVIGAAGVTLVVVF